MDKLIENVGIQRALAMTIIDMFEDILDKHGIKIPDEDRTGDESEACIYGMTYATLEDKIAALFEGLL